MATTNFTMLVHNRPRLTAHALESLARAGMDGMTVTILDDASDPETAMMLRQWCDGHECNLVRNPESCGTGLARNTVVALSEITYGRGDYLYLSDNDVFFYPTWLRILIECYEQAWDWGFRAIGAYNHPFHQPVGDSIRVYGAYEVRQVHALALQSMIMKWEVWDKYGPFCATPVGRVCQSEDVDFARKLTADGFKLGVVNPPLLVNTGITNSFGEHIPGWEMVRDQCPAGVICE